ncbi:InlB B-repeat-containing protein [Candidatus Saccharibacteria bacterium]|nr:InlB B-repeat-containing protein [Candidatus Saccharibacteria bacterium]
MRITKKVNLFLLGWLAALVPVFVTADQIITQTPVAHAGIPTITACAGNPECFAFTIDTRMTDTLDTDLTHYDETATTFSIPTSGYVNRNIPVNTYSWTIDWGDNSAPQTCSGSSSTTSTNLACGTNATTATGGISHTYITPGEYQITVRPSATATIGWFNAFGFYNDTADDNVQANQNMFKSIDTPLTNLMRTQGSTYRFAYMFYGVRNATEIPANLFDNIDTTSDTDFSSMFYNTFNYYASSSITGTIPADLFDNLNTTNGTNFSSMFYNTFSNYARRTATFKVNGSQVGTVSTFAAPYSTKIGFTGIPSTNPTVNATTSSQVIPTYNATIRTITAPAGTDAHGVAYVDYGWYRTDGTSCAVINPTPDCGIQDASTLTAFPNSTEWTSDTPTEKGNVTFYSLASIVMVRFVSNGGSFVPGYSLAIGSGIPTPINPTMTGFDFVGWFADPGLTQPWNFASDTVTDHMALYAKWKPISAIPGVPNTGVFGAKSSMVVSLIDTIAAVIALVSLLAIVVHTWLRYYYK